MLSISVNLVIISIPKITLINSTENAILEDFASLTMPVLN